MEEFLGAGTIKLLKRNIIAEITDPLGINLTKELGHSIIIKNLDNQQSIDITDNFFYDNNSITTGRIDLENYFITGVEYSLIAWDNANNPSEQQIRLISSDDEHLKLYSVYNFPNPFISDTKFTFELSQEAGVEINIYTLGGKKIKISYINHINQVFIQLNGMGKMSTENYYQMESICTKLKLRIIFLKHIK